MDCFAPLAMTEGALAMTDLRRVRPPRVPPSQAIQRLARGAVFAADEAGIAEFVEAPKNEVVVQLAGPRLVTHGNGGDLDVADDRHQGLEALDDAAVKNLA